LFEKNGAGTFSLVICSDKRSQSPREHRAQNKPVPKKHKPATRNEKKAPISQGPLKKALLS